MSINNPQEDPHAREGMLDPQLPLLDDAVALPLPISHILKRDGSVVAFDALKIARAIGEAGRRSQEIDSDTSYSLASAIAMYLARRPDLEDTIPASEVRDAVERVLTEMGYESTAQSYSFHAPQGTDIAPSDSRDETTNQSDSQSSSPQVTSDETLHIPIEVAEQMIRVPSALDSTLPMDPEGSSRLLAARVKHEFALAKVYSKRVADAHNRGDLFLHYLGDVDRLSDIALPLERLKRFGMETAEGQRHSSPAREPETLIAQMAGQTAALRPYFVGDIRWEAVNFSLAPYVHQLDHEGLQDVAKVLLYEFGFRALSDRFGNHRTQISLHWDMPEHMYQVELAGPGGAFTERTCSDYEHVAREFALAILDVYSQLTSQDSPIPLPLPIIHLTPQALERTDSDALLDRAARVATAGGRITICCESAAPFLPHAGDPLSPLRVVAHRVTLNLPRAAFRSHDEASLFSELDRLVHSAFSAHLQKHKFIVSLVGKNGNGPLGLLAEQRDGRRIADPASASYVLGVAGLNECVHAILGSSLHESPDAADLGERILNHLRDRCEQWTGELEHRISLEPTTDIDARTHFAHCDSKRVSRGTSHQEGFESLQHCNAGIGVESNTPLSERIQIEGRYHPILHAGALTHINLDHANVEPAEWINTIRQAFLQTDCRGIAFE